MKKKYIFFLLLVLLFTRPNVSATTITDYRNDLAKLKEEKKQNEINNVETQNKIDAANKEIENINASIVAATKEMEQTELEIKDLEKKIEKKQKQIKDLVVFLQASNSENFYLKYIFGAENFTDLIYRIAVIEQLSTASDELIIEMNTLIKQNEAKIVELSQKKVELAKLNDDILVQINKLGKDKSKYFDEGADIDDQIKSYENQIQSFLAQGCNEIQDLNTCISEVPSFAGYIRPVKSGAITDNYGYRVNPCPVCSAFHKGVDIENREGTPILAAAAGKVSNIIKYDDCGGKVLTINHLVNGKRTSTRYWHLLTIDVKVGDIVAQGQKVATMGGGNTAYYDSCTTGAHLHFEVVEGYYNTSTYYSKVRNPRDYVDFPAYGVWW